MITLAGVWHYACTLRSCKTVPTESEVTDCCGLCHVVECWQVSTTVADCHAALWTTAVVSDSQDTWSNRTHSRSLFIVVVFIFNKLLLFCGVTWCRWYYFMYNI